MMSDIFAAGPPAPPATDVGSALIWWAYYAALASAIGLGLVAGILVPHGPLARRSRVLALPIAAFVAVTAVLELAEVASTRQKTALWSGLAPSTLADFFTRPLGMGKPTGLTLAQMVAYVVLVACLVALWATAARAAAIAVFAAGVAVVVIPQLPIGPVLAQRIATGTLTALHFTAATMWVGGLVILAVVGALGRRGHARGDVDDDVAADWARVWPRFSIVALCAVGALIISGSWMAWMHVGTPAQLFTTDYGRLLLVKLALVLALIGVGAYNSRVLLPRIRAAQNAGDGRSVWRLAVEHFPKVVAGEALLGLTILGIVPFFTGSARAEAGWPTARSFDLTVFGAGVLLTTLVVAALWSGARIRTQPQTGLSVEVARDAATRR